MATYTVYSIDAKTGEPVGELPWTGTLSFENVLSGTGQARLRLPLHHPKATRSYLAPGKRELGITRDGIAVWNGPITRLEPAVDDDGDWVDVVAATPTWYLAALLYDRVAHFKRDEMQIAKAAFDHGMGKSGTTYRFTITNTTNGVLRHYGIGAGDTRSVLDIINDLASGDPNSDTGPEGFDYRVDVTYRAATNDFSRNLFLPGGDSVIGADRTGNYELLLSGAAGITAMGLVEEVDRAGTRWVGLGGGTGKTKLVATAANTAAENSGYVRIERVVQRANVHNLASLQSMTRHAMRLGQPPHRLWTVRYRPTAHLPYGAIGLGDKVRLDGETGMLAAVGTARVVRMTTDVDEAMEETVVPVFIDPLDQAAI